MLWEEELHASCSVLWSAIWDSVVSWIMDVVHKNHDSTLWNKMVMGVLKISFGA